MPKRPKPPMRQLIAPAVRQRLRIEFADFFTEMLREEPGWPAIPDDEFVQALADSLMDMGERSGRGVAFLQTMIIELQEQVNVRVAQRA